MAQPSVIPKILAVLEPYLERQQAEWVSQPEDARVATLPDVGGKVAVRNLVRALKLPTSYEQHFYNKPELRALVNAVATTQGMAGIGSREDLDAADKVAESRLTHAQQQKNDYARALAEAHAQIGRLRQEVTSLRAQLELRAETGMTLRRYTPAELRSCCEAATPKPNDMLCREQASLVGRDTF